MPKKEYVPEKAFIISPEIDHQIANIMFAPNCIFIYKKDINYPKYIKAMQNLKELM